MMNDKNYIIADEIVFEAKPDAVPYNYRISYKIAQLCLIMEMCSRGGCSLLKLHMISIGLSTKKRYGKVEGFGIRSTCKLHCSSF